MRPALQIRTPQRRARLAHRHLLDPSRRVTDPVEAARSVVALHATDPATVHLSAIARMESSEVTDVTAVSAVGSALYEERSLVRLLGMRRSMFVMPLDLAPVVQAACSRSVADTQRRRLVKELAASGIGPDPGAWLASVEQSVLAALHARGTATAAQLSADEPLLQTKLGMSEGTSYGATVNITSRVLFQLGADGWIVRGRPRGSWTSTQYVWSPMDTWLDGGLPDLDPDTARAELIRRWLAAFGPAPVADITWWTGLGLGAVRKALAALELLDVDLGEGQDGVVLADDVEPAPEPSQPWVALLPGLDPTPMGWQQRDWYLGDHARQVTDRTGNIGPTLWWQGRVVGAWAQRASGEIVHRLLEDIGTEGRNAVDDAAAQLTERLGPARFSTKFPAPLDRQLRTTA